MAKQMSYDNLKASIIVHCLNYFDEDNQEEKELALSKLKRLSKFYNLTMRPRAIQGDTKQALKEFILNKNGFINTIPKLYNLLYFERK